MLTLIYLLLYFVIGITLAGFIFFGLIFGAMYMKIPTNKLKKIIELGNLDFRKTVYDLGAGLGTIAFEASYTGARVVAVEIDPFKVAAMKILLRYNNTIAKAQMFAPATPGMKKTQMLDVQIIRSNLSKVDLSDANVVYCYLSPALMPIVGARAKAEMKSGSKVISVEHQIKGWNPTFANDKEKIYVYTV
jgi:adenine-specific DNA methylase